MNSRSGLPVVIAAVIVAALIVALVGGAVLAVFGVEWLARLFKVLN